MVQAMHADPAGRREFQAADAERGEGPLEPSRDGESPVRQDAVVAEIDAERTVQVQADEREHHSRPRKEPRQERQRQEQVKQSEADDVGPDPGVPFHADGQGQRAGRRWRADGGGGSLVAGAGHHGRDSRRRRCIRNKTARIAASRTGFALFGSAQCSQRPPVSIACDGRAWSAVRGISTPRSARLIGRHSDRRTPGSQRRYPAAWRGRKTSRCPPEPTRRIAPACPRGGRIRHP